MDQGRVKESLVIEVVDTFLYKALEVPPDTDRCKSILLF